MTTTLPSATLIRDLYVRMLLTRIVDDYAWQLHEQGRIDFVASCRGHEAAQVGSAVCIEAGKDFTLPYYRDLGVVLTIGMTPYEVFRAYLHMHQLHCANFDQSEEHKPQAFLHWGYQKYNTVTGTVPIATQILHAAGIAFACKIAASKSQKETAVTVAYCSDGATTESDFLEGIRFAAQQQLPAVFVCEQDCTSNSISIEASTSCLQTLPLPDGMAYQRVNGSDVIAVYAAMQQAMQQARSGNGPILLEMCVVRSTPLTGQRAGEEKGDPLQLCQHYLQQHHLWDEMWATELHARLLQEVEQALQDALRTTL